jgi:FkbM family methyltransferase
MAFLKKLVWKLISRPRREVTLDTWNGRLTFNSGDQVIGKMLFAHRSFEREGMREVVDILKGLGLYRNGTVLDVGANLGMICIGFVRNGIFKRGLAFEPDPYNFDLLQRNVVQNALAGRISCYNVALSAVEGTYDLEQCDSNYGDHRLRLTPDSPRGFYDEQNRRTVQVRVQTLDQLARSGELNLDEAVLAWVDIQGHEGYFLQGADCLISRAVPVATEFWPYAIFRAGMSKEAYLDCLMPKFSSYIRLGAGHYRPTPIESFPGLFNVYTRPREMGTVLLLNH